MCDDDPNIRDFRAAQSKWRTHRTALAAHWHPHDPDNPTPDFDTGEQRSTYQRWVQSGPKFS